MPRWIMGEKWACLTSDPNLRKPANCLFAAIQMSPLITRGALSSIKEQECGRYGGFKRGKLNYASTIPAPPI
ncbi:hypothetical protein CEXT_636461 [Caerostris extrusa]|uniref:Uncharacterized protein n=1 Tax=Caerostris extrusa TaxID=172846 RepID=A0AAV4XC45_CAEEX|nr:hypothetical protein CEXT_636461 [Caerostris extrusa]